jgi:hypothetical protein
MNAHAPTAAELPVTRAMLSEVRTELLQRIDQSKNELRGEIQELRGELRGEIHRVQAGLHAVHAEVARIGLLVEEQNARNRVVLDGLMAMITRQERLELRVDKVEDTVRGLASARPPR